MKTFILGLPNSGRTTVAQSLTEDKITYYVSAVDWMRSTFRKHNPKETDQDYDAAFQEYYIARMKLNPRLCIDNVLDIIDTNNTSEHFVIDGILNPKDFIHLFDYNEDVVVFLNRTDNMSNGKDYESVSINVMRDYCVWLATMGFLPKDRWVEYNYKIPGEESDFIKTLGARNSVIITKSITRAIKDLRDKLWHLQQVAT